MMKIALLALFVACASASLRPSIQGSYVSIEKSSPRGPVPITLCAGDPQQGTAHELRISGCDGQGCVVQPGQETTVEGDFTPAIPATNARFVGLAVVAGIPVPIAEGDLGALTPGQQYRVTQTIIVSDALVGLSPIVRISVSTETNVRIVCVETRITIGTGQ